MATPFHVELVTPDRILYSGDAEEVMMRTDGGDISFLAGHEDFIGAIDIGVVRILGAAGEGTAGGETGGEVRAAVLGGFVHVNHDGLSVLAGVAEIASEIDVERARRALEAAQAEMPNDGSASEQVTQVAASSGGVAPSGAMLASLAPDAPEVALRRAQARLEAAGAASATG